MTSRRALKSARSSGRSVYTFIVLVFMACRDNKHIAFMIQLVGVWLISQWMKAGESRKLRIVELGPGRGTLMDDLLRVCVYTCASLKLAYMLDEGNQPVSGVSLCPEKCTSN